MRDPKRIERILNKIREIWINNPDLRLMQILLNVLHSDASLYYIEDELLEKALEYYKDKK